MNRAEFFAKLEPFHAPSTLLEIELAYTLAKYSHRSQVRKEPGGDGEPMRYFDHVRRVALVLIDEMRIHDESMIISALLHDGMEDTRDLTPAMIEHCFGDEVTVMVKLLSKIPKDGYVERLRDHWDFRPAVIKMCDRLDNLRSLKHTEQSFQERQKKETQEIYIPLFLHTVMRDDFPQALLPKTRRMIDEIDRLSGGLE